MLLPDPKTCRRLAVDVAPRWVWFAGMAFTTKMERGRIDFVSPETGAMNKATVLAILEAYVVLDE